MNKKIKIILSIIFILAIIGLSIFLQIKFHNVGVVDIVNSNLDQIEESSSEVNNRETVAIFDDGANIDYVVYGDDKNRYDLIYKKDAMENIFWRGGSAGGDTYADSELLEEERYEQAFVKIDVLNNDVFLMQTRTMAGYYLEIFNIDNNNIKNVFTYSPFEEYKIYNNLIYGYGYWRDEPHILVFNLDTYEVEYDEIDKDIFGLDNRESLNILDNFSIKSDGIYYKEDLIFLNDLAEDVDYCAPYRYDYFEGAELYSFLNYFDYESENDGIIGFCRDSFDINKLLFIAKQGVDGVKKITEYFTITLSNDIYGVDSSDFEPFFIDHPFEDFKIEDFDNDGKKEIIFYSSDCGGSNAGCTYVIHVFDFETEEFEYMSRYINGGPDEAVETRSYFSENIINEREEYFINYMDDWFDLNYGENWEKNN